MRKSNFCGPLLGELPKAAPAGGLRVRQVFRTTAKRRNIYHAGTKSDDASVICAGWAFRFAQLPDGRRQILSVLLPGDLISPIGVFAEKLKFSVQALTDVRHCAFSRDELQTKIPAVSGIFSSFIDNCIADVERYASVLADLGRRSATERISRFILGLMERLDERNLVEGQSFAFPLRQQHLADAVGLTPVHVNRVIARMRVDGLIAIEKERLKVLNLAELRQIAGMR